VSAANAGAAGAPATHTGEARGVAGEGGADTGSRVVASGVASGGSAEEGSDLLAWDKRLTKLRDLEVTPLVVTIADPVGTPYARTFDSTLKYLALAAARAGWLSDRRWLPWLASGSEERSCREHTPGVMLFRETGRSSERRKLLMALLVGETPSRGVHARAWIRSLELALRVSDRTAINVIGPTFSGTSDTLYAAIQSSSSTKLAGKTLNFLSTATSDENPVWLRSADVHGTQLNFSATLAPDSARTDAMYSYLFEELKVDPSEIALLTEAGTQYGATAGSTTEAGAGHHTTGTRVDFTPNLAALRSEHAKQSDEGPGNGQFGAGLPFEPVDLTPTLEEEEEKGRWEPLPYLSRNTTVSDDVVLNHLLDQLAYPNVRYVGIIATQAEDVVFLAQRIRQSVADVRLFTIGLDTLYLHPHYSAALDGMLVASNYPYLGLNAPDGSAARCRTAFSSDNAQGFYNAALIAMSCGESCLCQYELSTECKQLETRVSVIAGGQVWPLNNRRKECSARSASYVWSSTSESAGKAQCAPTPSPLLWTFLLLLTSGLGIVSAREYWRFRGFLGRRQSSAIAPRASASPFCVFAPARGLAVQTERAFATWHYFCALALVSCWRQTWATKMILSFKRRSNPSRKNYAKWPSR
jgi:hypothetical protein